VLRRLGDGVLIFDFNRADHYVTATSTGRRIEVPYSGGNRPHSGHSGLQRVRRLWVDYGPWDVTRERIVQSRQHRPFAPNSDEIFPPFIVEDHT
jgi:hypothetical protein